MTYPKVTIHFFQMDPNSTAFSSWCKQMYDTIKANHKGFWMTTVQEDERTSIQKLAKIDEILKKYENQPLALGVAMFSEIRQVLEEKA